MKRAREYGGLFRFVTLLAISVAMVPGSAQTGSDQDLMSMNLEDLTHVKVYSASRHMEDSRKAPSSVSIITAEDIRRYGWRTLGDALRSLRGFYTSNDRLYSFLGVRGFMRPGDYNSRVLLLVNGHRLNDNVYDTAQIGTDFPLDLDLIDHIEVVRGPGSSLFGTNAIFGVINVMTRRPSHESTVEASGESSSFLGRTGRLTANFSKGDLTALFSANTHRDAGHSTLYFPAYDAPETNNGYAEGMDGTHFEQAFFDVNYKNFRLQGMLEERIKKFPTAYSGVIFNDPADRVDDARGYIDAAYHRLSTQTNLDFRIYYDAYNFVGGGPLALDGPGSRSMAFEKSRADSVGAEANLTRKIGAQRITVGGVYEHSVRIVQRDFFAGQPDLFHSSQSPSLVAIYGDAELNLVPRLIIHAGARVDWFNTFGSAVSPRFALIYSPGSRTDLKYILGSAFRAPNAREEYYADDITITAAPKELVPERILSNQLIFERSLAPWLSITADVYYNRLEKLIDQVPANDAGLTYFVNAGRVHGKGLEIELDAKRESGLAARASFTVSSTKDDAANTSSVNSPSSQAALNATLPISRLGFASLELIYLNALTDYQGTRVPPYLLPNLTVSSRPSAAGWQFSASCYNAMNRKWFNPMGPNDLEDQIQQDGRTYRVKLSYRFSVRGGRGGK